MNQTERHTAVVAENADPETRGRIKVRCAGILGSEDAILRHWVWPCLDWGFFLVPDVGEQIEIEVVSGSDRDEVRGQAFLEEPNFRYRGKRFNAPGGVSEFFTEANYGKRRGFATPSGHVLMFDDTDGARKVNLAWCGGGAAFSMLSFDEDGSVVLANKNGSLLFLNARDGEMALMDEHGNSISSKDGELRIIDQNSNIISMKGTTVQLLAQSALTLSCKDAVIDAGKVQLAGSGATEALILGTSFMTDFSAWIANLMTMLGTITPTPSGLATFVTQTTAFTETQLPADVSLKSFTK